MSTSIKSMTLVLAAAILTITVSIGEAQRRGVRVETDQRTKLNWKKAR